VLPFGSVFSKFGIAIGRRKMSRYTEAEQTVAAILVVGLLAMGKDNPRIKKVVDHTLSLPDLAVDMYEECLTSLETRRLERNRKE
jgi:hypothetical protein